MFEYYVLNENYNTHKIEPYNIFNNWILDESVEKEVKKYLRAPRKYKHIKYGNNLIGEEEVVIYGFEAFCEELRKMIMWQEWSRIEYEIVVKSMFDRKGETEQKTDCYEQCLMNIPMIAREIIYQYKKHKKGDDTK